MRAPNAGTEPVSGGFLRSWDVGAASPKTDAGIPVFYALRFGSAVPGRGGAGRFLHGLAPRMQAPDSGFCQGCFTYTPAIRPAKNRRSCRLLPAPASGCAGAEGGVFRLFERSGPNCFPGYGKIIYEKPRLRAAALPESGGREIIFTADDHRKLVLPPG